MVPLVNKSVGSVQFLNFQQTTNLTKEAPALSEISLILECFMACQMQDQNCIAESASQLGDYNQEALWQYH